MHGPTHLTGGGDEDLGLGALGQPQHVDGADCVGLDGLDGVVHVVGRGGGGRQVVDLVHLDEQGIYCPQNGQSDIGFVYFIKTHFHNKKNLVPVY